MLIFQLTVKTLDERCCCNIEVKFPSPVEIKTNNLIRQSLSINSYCNSIVKLVEDQGKKRSIYYSSFHPEIAMALKFKQSRYPVFFIGDFEEHPKDCPTMPVDLRSSSVQQAYRFIKANSLDGLVCDSRIFLHSGIWTTKFINANLEVWSYGDCNRNDKATLKFQKDCGVSGFITDDISFTKKHLLPLNKTD